MALDPEAHPEALASGLGTLSALNSTLTGDLAADAAALAAVQRHLVEHTRLGIPALAHSEGLAGAQIPGATAFPQSLGLAATWEPALATRVGEVVRGQLLAFGIHGVHSPLFDLGRDPRWGRIGETYGEDPYLVSQLGCAYVRGVQGDDEVMATAKHFVGYGAAEGGRNGGDLQLGERRLLDTYCVPFEAAIHEGGVHAVMNSYGLVNDEPVATSRHLLTDVLRDRLGFAGPVVADYGSVHRAVGRYRTALTPQEAGISALLAGIDVEQPTNGCYQHLTAAVHDGLVDEAVVDAAVGRVLTLKFRLGLFENPYARGDLASELSRPEHLELAREAAERSVVLLANDGTLPLRPGLRVAVVGPVVDDATVLFGGYSALGSAGVTNADMNRTEQDAFLKVAYEAVMGEYRERFLCAHGLDIQGDPTPEQKQQILALLRASQQGRGKVYAGTADYLARFHPGCRSVRAALTDALGADRVTYAAGCGLRAPLEGGIAEALRVAADADVIVAVLGGRENMRAEDASCGENRDNANIDLEPAQRELVRALLETGKPVVTVLVDGRPLAVTEVAERGAALLHAWLPGEQGAEAIVGVLTGAVNPGGRLPVTVLRHVAQAPMRHDRPPMFTDPDLHAEYIEASDNLPLFPFGYGLTYTSFAYSDLDVDPEAATDGGVVTARFTVTNTGDRAGGEVVQMYAAPERASVARPVQQLVGFRRIRLDAGEARRLEFRMAVRQLAFHDLTLRQVVEPGRVDLAVAASSADVRLRGSFILTGRITQVARRAFTSTITDV